MRATKVNAGLAENKGRLLLGIWRDSLHVTCGLTACTPGSAPGPTLGNEYGKTLPLPLLCPCRPSVAYREGSRPRPIVVTVSVSVCPRAKYRNCACPIFVHVIHVRGSIPFWPCVAIRYALPVLRMTSCMHIMTWNKRHEKACVVYSK